MKLKHKAGADIKLTEYISRHPVKCVADRCQVCQYVSEEVSIGDTLVNQITVTDIINN